MERAARAHQRGARIAKALDIFLDYLSELTDTELDREALSRIDDIATLNESEKQQVYAVVDALIRDHKANSAKK